MLSDWTKTVTSDHESAQHSGHHPAESKGYTRHTTINAANWEELSRVRYKFQTIEIARRCSVSTVRVGTI